MSPLNMGKSAQNGNIRLARKRSASSARLDLKKHLGYIKTPRT
jgi:hypothetical protein